MPDDLVERCRSGDRGAFGELFDLSRDFVFAVAVNVTGDRNTATDLTQEVFTRLLSRIQQFRGDCAFTTWLYRIVVNVSLDYRRGRRRMADALVRAEPHEIATGPTQEEEALVDERKWRLRAALLTLKPSLRVPLILRYVEGLSYDEIGDVLQISSGTVASRLSRAHAALGRALEQAARRRRP